MNSNSNLRGRAPSEKPATIIPVVLTPKEAAQRLRLSSSWLAKARMRGDGPPYIPIGRAIRYTEAALIQWMKSRQRLSPSEQ
jgi:predicted DNA-binding transcriptional regulator AlpA